MMGTIIGAILGFLAAVLPSVFTALAEYFEHRKDMDETAQKIDAAKAGVTVSSASPKIVVSSSTTAPPPAPCGREDDDEAELEAGYVKPLFVRAFATLRAGVRPLITYGFFAMFVFVKLYALFHGFDVDKTPATHLLPIVWDEGSQALFAAVLAFWFGSRAIEKQQEAKATAAGKKIVGD